MCPEPQLPCFCQVPNVFPWYLRIMFLTHGHTQTHSHTHLDLLQIISAVIHKFIICYLINVSRGFPACSAGCHELSAQCQMRHLFLFPQTRVKGVGQSKTFREWSAMLCIIAGHVTSWMWQTSSTPLSDFQSTDSFKKVIPHVY